MSPIAPYFGEAVQATIAIVSTVLMAVSINAYKKRPEGRYLLLLLAFAFFCIASVGEVALSLFVGLGPGVIALFERYVIPSLELLTVASFLVAIIWTPRLAKRSLAVFFAVVISVGLLAATSYVAGSGDQARLPPGCEKRAGGFLIIASSLGYNDSIAHGAPVHSWPILDVTKGTEVSITLCNTYSQSVGFQVAHYLTGNNETIGPGHVFNVDFTADQTGTFVIYCSVFSPIHIYLQGGELNVF